MLSGTPVRNTRKPLDDISNNVHNRTLGEHVTPKKRRLENSNDNDGPIQFEIDPLSSGKLHHSSPKRTPAKLPTSSTQKPFTPSNIFPHPESSFSKCDSTSCRNEGKTPESYLGQAKRPFPEMNHSELPSEAQFVKDFDEQLPHLHQHKLSESQTLKENIAKSACELLSKKRSRFRELSIHLQLMRGKYNIKLDRSNDIQDESIAVYTEIPLVKEKLVYWKQKYNK